MKPPFRFFDTSFVTLDLSLNNSGTYLPHSENSILNIHIPKTNNLCLHPSFFTTACAYYVQDVFSSLTVFVSDSPNQELAYLLFAQSPSHVQLFKTPWTATHQAFLSLTISWSLPKFTSTGDDIQPSHPLSPFSSPTFNLSQHQGLFQ